MTGVETERRVLVWGWVVVCLVLLAGIWGSYRSGSTVVTATTTSTTTSTTSTTTSSTTTSSTTTTTTAAPQVTHPQRKQRVSATRQHSHPVRTTVAEPTDLSTRLSTDATSNPTEQPPSAFLTCLRSYETGDANGRTGGDYTADGTFKGAYQYLQSTWNAFARKAGYADWVGVNPAEVPPAVQDAVTWWAVTHGHARDWPNTYPKCDHHLKEGEQ